MVPRKVRTMKIRLSPLLTKAVESELDRAEQENAILDVYWLADKIQAAHPGENVAVEDIVAALLAGRGGIGAIEFTPRTGTILEVILSGPARDTVLEPDEELLSS